MFWTPAFAGVTGGQEVIAFGNGHKPSFLRADEMEIARKFEVGIIVWAPLLACPAVHASETLLDKPAVAPTNKSVITFENCFVSDKLFLVR